MRRIRKFEVIKFRELPVSLPLDKEGTLYLLESDKILSAAATRFNNVYLDRMDRTASYLDYWIEELSHVDNSVIEKLNANLICRVEHPFQNSSIYVATKADETNFELAVSDVISNAESIASKFCQEKNNRLINSLSEGEARHLVEILRDTPLSYPINTLETQSDSLFVSNFACCLYKESMFHDIDNFGIDGLSPKESKAVLLGLLNDKNVMKKLEKLVNQSAASCTLELRDFSMQGEKFCHGTHFAVCIVNKNNNVKKLLFKNAASWCIYIMYMIDRKINGKSSKRLDLSLETNKNAFCEIYKTIFCDKSESEAIKCYDTLFRAREGRSKGRYDEYMSNIGKTLIDSVGNIDSIPFNIETGRPINIAPEKINFPQNSENLLSLKIA